MTDKKDCIVLLSKQSGITSFSSLWQVKNALGTRKIGHTGTLDTFAEGLLVVLTGSLTHLVQYVTDCDKTYQALIQFGIETDTLDPDGAVINQGECPVASKLHAVLSDFTGTITQVPPAYSAVHVQGKRASDRVRSGEEIVLSPRNITVYALECKNMFNSEGVSASDMDRVSSMIIEVRCSKGTYIRSLARDIAYACGSVSYLKALRRTSIGPFELSSATGVSLLSPFPPEKLYSYGIGEKPIEAPAEEIRAKSLHITPELIQMIGLHPVGLDPQFKSAFFHGVTPLHSWFYKQPMGKSAVFCETEFLGVIDCYTSKIRYDFVAGTPK